MLQKNMGNPPKWESALTVHLSSMRDDEKHRLRSSLYLRFFESAPTGQSYFKQSNTYLHSIAERMLAMTILVYREPSKLLDDIISLGHRHVGYRIPISLFGPFVSAFVEVMSATTNDRTTIDAFRWSIGLLSKSLTRSITECATIVMRAVSSNSQKALVKAVSCAPRGERAQWMLSVHVGSQHISPLHWAIERGAIEAAGAIIQDLLTIRADRERYYFGMDELFERHPEIVQTLCNHAPVLLPLLFDRLVWRSRLAVNRRRRCNYYIKHLLVNPDGSYASTFKWIGESNDSKIACHPVIALLSNVVWVGVSRRAFLVSKMWFVFMLVVFAVSQSALEPLRDANSLSLLRRIVISCKVCVYGLHLPQLIFQHSVDTIKVFRESNTVPVLRVFSIPVCLTGYSSVAKVCLTCLLLRMLIDEPSLWCWERIDGMMCNA